MKYSNDQKNYWKNSKKWYEENRDKIKISSDIIEVDFKNKRVIKGISKSVKNFINNKAA